MSHWYHVTCLCCLGHVGVPVPCNVVKLVDVEEMNYFASNNEGEVMFTFSP